MQLDSRGAFVKTSVKLDNETTAAQKLSTLSEQVILIWTRIIATGQN